MMPWTTRILAVPFALAVLLAGPATAQEIVPVDLTLTGGSLTFQHQTQITGAATIDYPIDLQAGDLVTLSLLGLGFTLVVQPPGDAAPLAATGMMNQNLMFTAEETGTHTARAAIDPAMGDAGTLQYDLSVVVRRVQ